VVPGFIFSKIAKIRKDWLLSVDIKPVGTRYESSQILLLKTQTDVKLCSLGIKKNSNRLTVKARVDRSEQTIDLLTPYDSLPMEQYSTFRLYQIYDDMRKAYIMEVVVNGIVLASKVNTEPQVFIDVIVYTSGDNRPSADVYIKRLYALSI